MSQLMPMLYSGGSAGLPFHEVVPPPAVDDVGLGGSYLGELERRDLAPFGAGDRVARVGFVLVKTDAHLAVRVVDGENGEVAGCEEPCPFVLR
jgi:hypothetical protein